MTILKQTRIIKKHHLPDGKVGCDDVGNSGTSG